MNNGHEKGEGNPLKDVIEEQVAKLKNKVEDLDLNEVSDQVKSYVRKSPWKSLAIAVGLGLLAGAFLKSNRD